MKNKKLTISFCRTAENGNIYDVVSRAVRVLNQAGKAAQAREMKSKVWVSSDYDAALEVIGQYVNLEETDE